MDKQIIELQTEVKDLFQKFNQGVYYDDLLDRLFALESDIVRTDKTSIRLPRLNKEDRERFNEVTHNMRFLQDEVSNEDLAFVVKYLGNRDPRIRDYGAYFAIASVVKNHILTREQLLWLKNYLLQNEIVFFHILEPTNDGVFTRSFAWLVLALIAHQDLGYYHVLSSDDYEQIMYQVVTYLILERDGRGYIKDKGWAHMYTHVASLFEGFAQTDLNRSAKLFIFNALFFNYLQTTDQIGYGDDKMVASSFVFLMKRDALYTDYIVEVLRYWNDFYKKIQPPENYDAWTRFYNQMHLFDDLMSFPDLPIEVREFIGNDLR